jgi:hypothetical protein
MGPASFQRNPRLYPNVTLGGHMLNRVQAAGPGRLRIIGLAPKLAAGGTIGELTLHMAPDAPLGASYELRVSGEVNLAGQGVTAIEPLVATVRVRAPGAGQPALYLPLVDR